ncbi:MAG: hypothetical protein AAF719_13390 [Pseudomonadota bacterium]
MQDAYLYAAGTLGIVISIVHGFLGETKIVAPSQAPASQAKRVMRAIMFISAVYWFAGGLVLLLTPAVLTEAQRPLAVYGAAFLFLTGSLGNFWATKGRHFGWMLLAVAGGLAVAGA